ncbi:MAG: transcriptional repressor LexA [Patescibacteria group bacterium]|jgi:DNA (cytosine-5)-methyltransferase 1|nr:transcriptional repressor LexA [Patescibacteria group bacterium]
MITKKQNEVLSFIKAYQKKKGYSPALEEIRKNFKLSSVSTAHHYVKKLEESGHLEKEDNHPRSISLSNSGVINIEIVGMITAGHPIEAVENKEETISVSAKDIDLNAEYFALKVKGESMIDEGIFDGDTVIIKKQSVAENGQTVVAIIDDNEATLKKLYREDGKFRLQPANQSMLPFYRKEVEVRGVVINVIRSLSEDKPGLRTLDLFAGIGGIRLGFEKSGFNTVFANDFDKACKVTYDLNFKTAKLVVEDMRKIGVNDLPEFDFLLGGFPCQSFSIAGYRKGFNDQDRGNLFFDIARIIESRRPAGFLLENVKNLKGHDGGKTFKIIEKTLKDLGYHVKSKILNSMEYGNVPQNRERIYIVGFKTKKFINNFEFPSQVKLKNKITDILESKVDSKYYYNGKPLFEKIKNDVKEVGKVYQWRRKYVRENKKGVCPTLTANMGMGGHNVPIIKDKKGIRKLTPRECASIQGFPKSYKLPKLADSALYKQLGNSVTVTTIEAIAKQMKNAIKT